MTQVHSHRMFISEQIIHSSWTKDRDYVTCISYFNVHFLTFLVYNNHLWHRKLRVLNIAYQVTSVGRQYWLFPLQLLPIFILANRRDCSDHEALLFCGPIGNPRDTCID